VSDRVIDDTEHAEQAAFHALTGARCVTVTGADRARYLEDVTTQHVTDLEPGRAVGALHLDPHGAPLAMFDIVVGQDDLTLIAPDDEVASFLVDRLGTRTFLLDARFRATDAAVVAVRGAAVDTAVAAAHTAATGQVLEVARPGGVDLVVDAADVDAVRAALTAAGSLEGGTADLDDHRVRSGVPAGGAEVRPPHLPEEAGVLPTHVHLAKGCYPGQEAVARMWMLGRPRRRLVAATVDLEVPAPVDATDAVVVEASSRTRDGRRVLGHAPATAEVGDAAVIDGRAARIDAVIGDAIPPGHDPAMRRRRDAPRPGSGYARQTTSRQP
jgi:tRNA-modifying protein YgfZ